MLAAARQRFGFRLLHELVHVGELQPGRVDVGVGTSAQIQFDRRLFGEQLGQRIELRTGGVRQHSRARCERDIPEIFRTGRAAPAPTADGIGK